MNISTVTKVIGIATKKDGTELKGVSKTGKPWTMYSCILENGTKLNLFGPVVVGDTVYDLVQDPQYYSWQGKVKKSGSDKQDMSQPTNAMIMNKLLEIETLIKKGVSMEQDTFNKEVILKDIDEGGQIDLSQIPF